MSLLPKLLNNFFERNKINARTSGSLFQHKNESKTNFALSLAFRAVGTLKKKQKKKEAVNPMTG